MKILPSLTQIMISLKIFTVFSKTEGQYIPKSSSKRKNSDYNLNGQFEHIGIKNVIVQINTSITLSLTTATVNVPVEIISKQTFQYYPRNSDPPLTLKDMEVSHKSSLQPCSQIYLLNIKIQSTNEYIYNNLKTFLF